MHGFRVIVRTDQAHTDGLVQTTLTPADFSAAQVDFVPHSLRDVKLQKSEIAWADIGGGFLKFLAGHSSGFRTASDGHHVCCAIAPSCST